MGRSVGVSSWLRLMRSVAGRLRRLERGLLWRAIEGLHRTFAEPGLLGREGTPVPERELGRCHMREARWSGRRRLERAGRAVFDSLFALVRVGVCFVGRLRKGEGQPDVAGWELAVCWPKLARLTGGSASSCATIVSCLRDAGRAGSGGAALICWRRDSDGDNETTRRRRPGGGSFFPVKRRLTPLPTHEMSKTARIFFGASLIFATISIGGVHLIQQQERQVRFDPSFPVVLD